MDSRLTTSQPIFTAKGATGTGAPMNVASFKTICLAIATASSGSMTIKLQGSIQATCPDFSASSTAANQWTYLGFTDLATNTVTAGATGIVYSGTDSVYTIQLLGGAIFWINATITALAAGTVTVTANAASN